MLFISLLFRNSLSLWQNLSFRTKNLNLGIGESGLESNKCGASYPLFYMFSSNYLFSGHSESLEIHI